LVLAFYKMLFMSKLSFLLLRNNTTTLKLANIFRSAQHSG
jgi:hypothetical protein